ncbi:nose resistant to fluoxetine protein 6 isoform X3, partial [Ixodes scapularis]
FLLPLMGSGPADKETYEMMVQECATSWWRVLTHNNNFLQDRAMCLQHFWYVGADMQIFVIIALPLTMLMIRFPKISCAVGIVAVVAFSTLTCVQIHLWDQLYAFNFGTFDTVKLSETFSLIYFRPFTHVGSYVLGILCGYSSFVHKDVRIHWFLLAAGVFTVSIFFAYLVHLMVEAPTMRFEKMILDRPTRLKSETNGRHRSEDKLEKSQL